MIRNLKYKPDIHTLSFEYFKHGFWYGDFISNNLLDSILEGKPRCNCEDCLELVNHVEEIKQAMVKAIL